MDYETIYRIGQARRGCGMSEGGVAPLLGILKLLMWVIYVCTCANMARLIGYHEIMMVPVEEMEWERRVLVRLITYLLLYRIFCSVYIFVVVVVF